MSSDDDRLIETVTLAQAKQLIQCAAHEQSFLLLSPPGVGKSDMVAQAAAEAGLPCRSLLGTQIAPEDVSGVPQIIGERSVFCPPRILLPESNEPFCLFLDELPACAPDIQKAFYSLLLERRIGEFALPKGTWVVAAGNRTEDRALVRTISSALVNRVVILQIRVDYHEWRTWAAGANIRPEILSFLDGEQERLLRPVPQLPIPFSTPRAWASLSRALDLAEQAGIGDPSISRALAQGRVSPEDAEPFCAWRQMVQTTPSRATARGYAGVVEQEIAVLGLSAAAESSLLLAGVRKLVDLIVLSRAELIRLDNFDHARADEVEHLLAERGLRLENA